MIERLRQLVWYERGAGFAEEGIWRFRPVAFIRVHGTFVALVFALYVGFGLSLVVFPWSTFFVDPSALLIGIQIAPFVIYGRRVLRLKRAMKTDVPNAAGVVCPRCLYDLNGVGQIEKCPECGQSVDMEKLPKQWARTVRGLRYPDGDREAVRGWMDV